MVLGSNGMLLKDVENIVASTVDQPIKELTGLSDTVRLLFSVF